jgi:hypothetical protein
MIKAVTATNYLGESMRMVLSDPKETGIKITGISGLGPPKATINTSKVSTVDGTLYNSATVEGRNIVISTELLDLPTVEEVRVKTYQYFPIKRRVDLLFETETRTVSTSGYVESNAPELFSEKPTQQISILCQDAYFFDARPDEGILRTQFYSALSTFEFPFSNESLENPLLEFGRLESRTETDIVYPGETEVGMTITITALGAVGDVIVYDPDTQDAMRISAAKLLAMTGSALVSGDVLTITTTRGNKKVILFRNGAFRNVRNALERTSVWLQLAKGSNRIAYSATSGIANLQISIESQILYEGV